MAVLEKMKGETEYELVKRRLDARPKGTPMSLEEAREIFSNTVIFIHHSPTSGKYGWSAIMSEDDGFNTPRSAVNDALKYLESGGY